MIYCVLGSRNNEKEKEKLANVMAFGQDLPPPSEQKRVPRPYVEPEEVPDIDRFDECKFVCICFQDLLLYYQR